MLARARSVLPHGPVDLLRQIVLFCGAYWLYRLVRGHGRRRVPPRRSSNARDGDPTRARRSGCSSSRRSRPGRSGTSWIIDAASWMYVNSHFVVTTVTLAFIYLRRNERFYFVRNMFMVAMGIALVGYVALSDRAAALHAGVGLHRLGGRTSPASTPIGLAPTRSSTRSRRCPSMHVAFALMLGVPMAAMARRALGEGAVAGATRRSSPSWSSRPPTTGGSTPSRAPLVAAVAAVAARAVRARAARPPGRGCPRHARAAPRTRVPRAMTTPPRRTRRAPVGARVPDADAQPADRVAADAERDLAHRASSCASSPPCWSCRSCCILGGIAFIVGSVCDTLDGRYSRMSGKGTPFGAFLDSTLDRIEEGIVLTAVAAHFSRDGRRRSRSPPSSSPCSPR